MSTPPSQPAPTPTPTPDPDPRDLFDQTILPDLPELPPELLASFRDVYVAGYRRALHEVSGALYAALPTQKEDTP